MHVTNKVREKKELTEEMAGEMGRLASQVSALLGADFAVVRTAEIFHTYRGDSKKYFYAIRVRQEATQSEMTFSRTENPNEVKRSLSMLVSLVSMGIVKEAD